VRRRWKRPATHRLEAGVTFKAADCEKCRLVPGAPAAEDFQHLHRGGLAAVGAGFVEN